MGGRVYVISVGVRGGFALKLWWPEGGVHCLHIKCQPGNWQDGMQITYYLLCSRCDKSCIIHTHKFPKNTNKPRDITTNDSSLKPSKMGLISRVTMFKVPDKGDQLTLIKAFDVLEMEQKKV